MTDSVETTEAPAAAPEKRVHAGLGARLYTWPWFHRAIPAAVLVRVMGLRGRLRWRRDPTARRLAIVARSVILEGTGREAEVEEIARKSLIERAAGVEIGWQKGPHDRARIEGYEHFEAALTAGKGVIVSPVHLGPSSGIARTITRNGPRILVPAGEWLMEGEGDDYTGRTARMLRRYVGGRGVDLINLEGSFPQLAQRLREGGVVYLPFDVPGSTKVTYLGKPTGLASGCTALAKETGAAVIPAFARRKGARIYVTMHEAHDPADFPDAQTMHQRLADIASAEVLGRPEAMATIFVPYLWPEVWAKHFSE